MKNEYIHNQNHSINPDADGPYRRVLSGLAYMVSVAGKISGTAVFLCTGGGVPAYKKSKEISAASISGKCRNGIFNQIMCMLQRKLDYVAYQPKNHNIFTTLFCAGVLICIWENRKEKKKFFTYIGIYIFWQAMVMGLAILAEAFDCVWRGNALLQTVLRTNYIFPLLGGIWDAEGGVFFIVLGVWLYCAVENKWKLALRYILFCGAYMFMCQGDILYWIMSRFSFWGYHKLADVIYFGSSFVGIPLGTSDLSLLTEFYQWMMIGALPIMLSCNGKRGKSLKWLFYAAYPLQFLVLYGISYYK